MVEIYPVLSATSGIEGVEAIKTMQIFCRFYQAIQCMFHAACGF
jgi:hypothetical protein